MASQQHYLVSARKYRPATFNTVVGQRALTATLKNAITSKRLAQAYLFCGPRGVGKTSCARIFAKTINCLSPTPDGEACGVCESCKAIESGNSFNLVELDAASNNSVDNIRTINEQVNIPPQIGHYKVFIIDEVHMLSTSAFNAFLKTLEEPPKNVIFILATTERHKVIPTILSRCQIYDFRRITISDIIDHLEFVAKSEGVETDRESLGTIAQLADGAMRDALSIFDQVTASTQGHVTYHNTIDALNVLDKEYYFRLVDIFHEGNVAQALLILKEITDKGFDAQVFINGLAMHIRNLMVASVPATMKLLETSEEMAKRYVKQASTLSPEWYYTALKILNDCDFQYRTSGNKRLTVELALIRLCRLLTPPSQKTIPQKSVSNQTEQPIKSVKDSPTAPSTSSSPFVKPAETKTQFRPETTKESNIKKPDNGKPKSFRLSDLSSKKPDSNLSLEKRNETFSKADFVAAWNEYGNLYPDLRILVSAMRMSLPENIEGNHYKVRVAHPAQKQAFEGEMSNLLQYLRDCLKNDYIALTVEIDESPSEQRFLSPKELLKKTINDNPELGKFLNDIEAELE